MVQTDYNRDEYNSVPETSNSGYGGYQHQQNAQIMGQQSGYPLGNQTPNSLYGQPSNFYNRSSSIVGPPAQSTPAIPSLSDEDFKIFKETQKDVMLKKFLPAAIIGCGAIYMAHQKKLFKPSMWTYGLYVVTASYVTQFTSRDELRRRIAESPSQSPFAQQVRLSLGYANKPDDGSFVEDSFSQGYNSTTAGATVSPTSPYYSPYNRFQRQKQAKLNSEFADESSNAERGYIGFTNDSDNEFAPDDVIAGDTGFRTRKVIDQTEKPERSRLTYDELRMRNRSQYTSNPNPVGQSYMQPGQPMNDDQSDLYNRPGSFS